MIEITNPIPVFDGDHNVITFKYNDGLVIHDCLTNTLNVSYVIVRELMGETKTLDNVLLELKEHFGLFPYVKCHDKDILNDILKNSIVKEDVYNKLGVGCLFFFTRNNDLLMSWSAYYGYAFNNKLLYLRHYNDYYTYPAFNKLLLYVVNDFYNQETIETIKYVDIITILDRFDIHHNYN